MPVVRGEWLDAIRVCIGPNHIRLLCQHAIPKLVRMNGAGLPVLLMREDVLGIRQERPVHRDALHAVRNVWSRSP